MLTPEPGALWLVGVGLLGFWGRRGKKHID
jgi:hypothetical protein